MDTHRHSPDLAEVRQAEEAARKADSECHPLAEAVRLAEAGVRSAEHAYRELERSGPHKVVPRAELDAAAQAVRNARLAKLDAEDAHRKAQDRALAANNTVAAAKAIAYAPIVDAAIKRRLENAARFDGIKAELARIESEAVQAGEVLADAVRHGAKLPGGHHQIPVMRAMGEAQERAMWAMR